MGIKRGQSISALEYTLLLTTMVTAIIWAVNKHVKPAVQQVFMHSAQTIEIATAQLPR